MRINYEIITGEVKVKYNNKLNNLFSDEVFKFRGVKTYQENVEVSFDHGTDYNGKEVTTLLIKIISPSRKKTTLIKKDVFELIKKVYHKNFILYCSINRFKKLGDDND